MALKGLRNVILGLERMSVGTNMTNVQNISCGSTFLRYTSVYQNPTFTCMRPFHTTIICNRVLNRRMHPINREPSKKGRWIELTSPKEKSEYTVRPLPMSKTGGRGPNGHIWNWRSGGGNKKNYRMLDFQRCRPDAEPKIQERVQAILYDPNRSANIALLAGEEHKRYIIATVNMKKGDILTSSSELFDSPIRATEGDSYPVGSLSIGTVVNSLEMLPGKGGMAARAAGTQAQIVRKVGDQVILRLPSKREVSVFNSCMATVGRVGNIAHNQIVIGKAGRNRWKGIRPKSGFFQKKTGRFGRKIKPPKAMSVFTKPHAKKPIIRRLPYDLLPIEKRPVLKSSLS